MPSYFRKLLCLFLKVDYIFVSHYVFSKNKWALGLQLGGISNEFELLFLHNASNVYIVKIKFLQHSRNVYFQSKSNRRLLAAVTALSHNCPVNRGSNNSYAICSLSGA